jgi:hypothetical protein
MLLSTHVVKRHKIRDYQVSAQHRGANPEHAASGSGKGARLTRSLQRVAACVTTIQEPADVIAFDEGPPASSVNFLLARKDIILI